MNREILSVSQLNNNVQALLSREFPLIWVEGEISNLSRPASGHWYFTLKDARAQVRAAMFRNRNRLLRLRPENGMKVLVRAQVSLYEPRGDYQLIVESLEEAGLGALQREFELLKQRLEKEGLFAPERRRALPLQPRCLGVVTSPSGAAIRDILTVLKRRYPALPVIIYPTPVQGKEAAAGIVAALERAQDHGRCDVLLLARGGGSLEDLWPFNEETVARAIAACTVPVVTGVGHETDITIADFVADQRAPTPSAAAELISPDGEAMLGRLAAVQQRLARTLLQRLKHRALELRTLERGLVHPRRRLQQQAQSLDELERRRQQAWLRLHQDLRTRLGHADLRLGQLSPARRLGQRGHELTALIRRLRLALGTTLERQQRRLSQAGHALNLVSPLATLDRGFAIVQRPADKKIIRDADELAVGDLIETRLARGHIHCKVEGKSRDQDL